MRRFVRKTPKIFIPIGLAGLGLLVAGCTHQKKNPAEPPTSQALAQEQELTAQAAAQDKAVTDTATGAMEGLGKLARQIFWDLPRLGIDYLTGNTPINSALRMEDPYFPDERREGINQLVQRDFAHKPPYSTRYQQIAAEDSSALVRATALRALNRARDASATPTFIRALADESELVRLEAAKALVNLPDPAAAPALVKVVTNVQEQRDVRVYAAEALKHYPSLDVARALIRQLEGRDFSIAWQSHRSLRRITGRDFQFDEAAWLNYLAATDNPFNDAL